MKTTANQITLKESIMLTSYASSLQGKQLQFNRVYLDLVTGDRVAIGDAIRVTARPIPPSEFALEIADKSGSLFKGKITVEEYAEISDTPSATEAFISKYLF